MTTCKKLIERLENHDDEVLVDVREPHEYSLNRAKKAINIPLPKIIEPENLEYLSKFNTIYVYCRSGNRSKVAASLLKSFFINDKKNIYDLGGLMFFDGCLDNDD